MCVRDTWSGSAAVTKSELKGVHRVKGKLSGGAIQVYFYAWRGGPRINGADGRPLTDPDTPEFRAAFDALKRPPAPKPKDMTVHDLIVKYRASTDLPKSTSSIRNYGMALTKIAAEFGDMEVAFLELPETRGDMLEWRDRMAHKPRTADYTWMVMSRLFKLSKDRGYIRTNPCERGGRLYESDRVDKIWSEEELARLFAVCSPEVYDVVVLALWTGQRQGDLLRLTWSAYDGQYIRLRQSKSRKHGKAGRSVVIPAGPTLQGVMAAIPRVGTTQILNSSDRAPWTSDGFRTSFGRAVERSGIEDRTFHDLRGTAVTRLAIAGCTAEQIATITGHSLKEVHQILDRHYLSRDVRLAEEAIARLETARVIGAGTDAVKRPVKRVSRSAPKLG